MKTKPRAPQSLTGSSWWIEPMTREQFNATARKLTQRSVTVYPDASLHLEQTIQRRTNIKETAA